MRRVVCVLAMTGLLLTGSSLLSARKWTSSDGKFSVEAELVSVDAGKVKLKKANGTVATVPVDRLSAEDRQYLEGLSAKAAPAREVSFTRDVQPLLAKCCVDCHRQKKARGGVRLEKYADIIKHSKKGFPVIPGNPAESRVIVTHAGGKQHPEKDSKEAQPEDKKTKAVPPTAGELALIENWIKAGAKDDSPAKP